MSDVTFSNDVIVPTVLTANRVAFELGVNIQTAWRLCRDGSIKSYKQNGRWYVLPSDLRAYIESGETSTIQKG